MVPLLAGDQARVDPERTDLFSTLWSVISPVLPAHTRSKVSPYKEGAHVRNTACTRSKVSERARGAPQRLCERSSRQSAGEHPWVQLSAHLLEHISADSIPWFLGGERTEAETFVARAEKIPVGLGATLVAATKAASEAVEIS